MKTSQLHIQKENKEEIDSFSIERGTLGTCAVSAFKQFQLIRVVERVLFVVQHAAPFDSRYHLTTVWYPDAKKIPEFFIS